ncbi:hypothetical protein ACQCRO_26115, partial [Ralstonia pseudosolanacearum]
MSNNGDLKPEGPPTLFESQSETDENGHTRILASLEGRVGASGKAPQKKGRRYGIAAAVAVLVAGIGATERVLSTILRNQDAMRIGKSSGW